MILQRFNFSSLSFFRSTVFAVFLLAISLSLAARKKFDYTSLPREIFSGQQGRFHVQGIACDMKHRFIYMSFTTELLKFDFQGRLLGSVKGITGHLGCIAFNPDDGRIYASVEYKHDDIGAGIQKGLGGVENDRSTAFYVAIFDTDSITRCGMDAAEVMKTVYIKEAVDDYNAKVRQNGKTVEHRYGCSGIDGVAIAPKIGKKRGRNYLYVAYGVYADKERTDNDNQVLLCYDIKDWKTWEKPLHPQKLHHSGPERPEAKYFVRTGNTTWGVQNLAYDPHNRTLLAAVYAGSKSEWPNYSLFAIDITRKPIREELEGVEPQTEADVLTLKPMGLVHEQSGVRGWKFGWGSKGLCPLGKGYYYISHNARDKESKRESTTAVLYKWNGTDPFERVE